MDLIEKLKNPNLDSNLSCLDVSNNQNIIDFLEFIKLNNSCIDYNFRKLDIKDFRFIFLFGCAHGRLDVCKCIYELSSDANNQIDIKLGNCVAFRNTFRTGFLWITDWLYAQSKINNSPYDLEKWFREFILNSISNDNYYHIIWLFEVFKKDNLKVKECVVREFIDKAIIHKDEKKLRFWTRVCKDYDLETDIINISRSCDDDEDFNINKIVNDEYYGTSMV